MLITLELIRFFQFTSILSIYSCELIQELAAPNRMTAVESLFTEDILRVLNLDLRKRPLGYHALLLKEDENIYR